MTSRDAPAATVPAATLLLLRNASAGLEVFMVERDRKVDFAHGALVFPGGKVDPEDADLGLRRRCSGLSGLAAEAAALRIAAIRETYEECGVLLARERGQRSLLDGTRLSELEARRGRDQPLTHLAETEDLELAGDLLVPFAHWITPESMPRRFDTHFFLVPAPTGQTALHDGSESVDSVWITPEAALADGEAGRRTLIFPTLLNLKKLARSRSVAEAIERAQREPIVTVLPRVARGPDGPVVRIPAEAGYEISEVPVERMRTG